jgi:hypothetical protein
MKLHGYAKTCPHSRGLLVERLERGWTLMEAAHAAGVSARTASKWRARWRSEETRACSTAAPHQSASRTAPRRSSPRDRAPASTADDGGRDRRGARNGALDRLGDPQANRARQALASRAARAAQPVRVFAPRRAAPHRRQEAPRFSRPDDRMLGPRSRAFRDRRRLRVRARLRRRLQPSCRYRAPARRAGAVGDRLPGRALASFVARGVGCERILTDTGYVFPARAYALACLASGLRRTRTRPRRPRTKGKAERFTLTMLSEWAYARLYATSDERARTLPLWPNHYNYRRRRPHGSLSHRPGSRLNNVGRNYIRDGGLNSRRAQTGKPKTAALTSFGGSSASLRLPPYEVDPLRADQTRAPQRAAQSWRARFSEMPAARRVTANEPPSS